jgi:hypothetical protein
MPPLGRFPRLASSRALMAPRATVRARAAARRHIRSARRAALRRVAEGRDRPAPSA